MQGVETQLNSTVTVSAQTSNNKHQPNALNLFGNWLVIYSWAFVTLCARSTSIFKKSGLRLLIIHAWSAWGAVGRISVQRWGAFSHIRSIQPSIGKLYISIQTNKWHIYIYIYLWDATIDLFRIDCNYSLWHSFTAAVTRSFSQPNLWACRQIHFLVTTIKC